VHPISSEIERPPSNADAVIAVAASVVAGVALWATRASLDITGTAAGARRVAMLPPWSELFGAILLALLMTSAVASLLHRVRPAAKDGPGPFLSPVLSDTLLPLFGLSFLIVPYLPYVADWIPVLRIFAGPARTMVWGIVLGQFACVLLPRVARRGRASQGVATELFTIVGIAGVTFALSAVALPRLMASEHFADSPVIPPDLPALVIRTFMVLGAASAALLWAWARSATGSAAAATAAWAGVCLGPAFAFNTFAVCPEVPLAFAVLAVMALLWQFHHRLPASVLYLSAVVVSATVWVFLTRVDVSRLHLASMPLGLAGFLFDQEYGVFAFAPALLLGVVSAAAMARDLAMRKAARPLGVAIAVFLVLAALIAPWWSKSAMAGQLILPVFPLLGLPLAWWYHRTGAGSPRRAAAQLLIVIGAALTVAIMNAGKDVPLPQEADGSSSVLQWVSHGWDVSSGAPSFVRAGTIGTLVRTSLWLGAFALFMWLCRSAAPGTAGRTALRTALYTTAICLATLMMAAHAPGAGAVIFDPESRANARLLETFDSLARPLAVRYDPFSFVSPASLPPMFSFAATRGQRHDPQPRRVLLNARFRLPSGEYTVELTGSPLAGKVPDPEIGLQIGREGDPLETWPLALVPGGHWQRRFQVPLDSEFVAFRSSREVDATIASMRVSPVNVVETRRRFATPLVRSAAAFPSAKVFFHDTEVYTEADGFWVKGRSLARMTISKTASSSPTVTVSMHSGPRPNIVTVSTDRWTELVELEPNTTRRVEIPSDATEQFIPLTIAPGDGFVPAEVEAGNPDRRLLGVWVNFVPGP
jgi:hypothetical protein